MANSFPLTLAVIPARGGSKGLPGKNLAQVGPHSMIGWAAKAALESNCLSRVIASTDCPEIADEARRYGVEVPFLRPPELSTDSASGIDVILHCLAALGEAEEDFHPEWILVLQPTSPLRTWRDVNESFVLLTTQSCDAVVSLTLPTHHPYLSQRINAKGFLEPLFPDCLLRRQELPLTYQPNGAIYWIRTTTLLRERTFYPELSIGYIMPAERSVDIDTKFDLALARYLHDVEPWRSADNAPPCKGAS